MGDVFYGNDDHREMNDDCMYKEDVVMESIRSQREIKDLKRRQNNNNCCYFYFLRCFHFLTLLPAFVNFWCNLLFVLCYQLTLESFYSQSRSNTVLQYSFLFSLVSTLCFSLIWYRRNNDKSLILFCYHAELNTTLSNNLLIIRI